MPLSSDADGPGAIAVMPFDSVTGDPRDAYLGDGARALAVNPDLKPERFVGYVRT